GRGRALAESPVKQRARQLGIDVYQPATLRDADAQAQLREVKPDLMVVVAYGLILPQAVLDIPTHGCWNVHASLLPRWRGAAPIQRAIEAGDAETGVDLMRMEKGLDTGPLMLRLTTPITDTDTGGTLHDRLSALGAEVLGDGLKLLRAGMVPVATKQPDEGATYAHKLEKAEARLDWAQPAVVLARKVRAFHPWPVAECELVGERLRVHGAVPLSASAARVLDVARHPPGTLVAATREGLTVACGEGALRLTVVQREGGKPVGAADFLNARPQVRTA
ncbi:MAG: methionyl-tRNA formyltransferase, partial [Lysobacteraceae bacterium]